jgi:guanylate cyclase
MVVSIGLALLSAGALVMVFFAMGEPVAGWLNVYTFSVYLGAFALFAVTGSVQRTVQVAVWFGLIGVLATHVALGGYAWSGGFVLWGIANCVVAAIWLDRVNTYLLMVAYGVSGLVLVVLEPAIQALRDRPDPGIAAFVIIDIFLATVLLTAPATLLLLDRIRGEQERSRSLLLNVLPESIADRLAVSHGWIADRYDQSTVLFADLVGFTEHAHTASPGQLLAELNTVFSRFDELVSVHGGEKIKTIGDGYMAAFGVPEPMIGHAAAACRLAVDMVSSLAEINRLLDTDFRIRVGIASGPSIGGVIGTKRFAFDLWGDDVNLASRLEGAARPGAILVSQRVADDAGDAFVFEPQGMIALKGMPGTMAFVIKS